MSVYPASAAFLLIWLVLILRNADNGIPMTLAVLPFGMFAAVVAGGQSIILAHFLAILTMGLLSLRWLSLGPGQAGLHLPKAGLYLAAFAVYSVFSAFVLVRLFEGRFLVFPMSVSVTGTQISIFFPSTMWPLRPSGSNLAQSVYVILSCSFFLMAVLLFRRRGLRLGETGLAWAAGLNAVLGALDLAGLDGLLALIRTADYTLNNHHTLSGFARIIGGFAEASSFGSASAAFFGYFMISFLMARRPRDGLLALANLICALLSLSSTGTAALAGAVLLILLHMRAYLGQGMSRAFAHWFVITAACLLVTVSAAILLFPVLDLAADMLERLIFTKSTTLSGLERGAWAQAGLDAFVQTWGLGAGVGSLRANGLLTVLLGSVGVPGTAVFLGFLWHSFGKPARISDPEAARFFYAGRICGATMLLALLVSGTGPDPTLLLAAAAAVSVGAREYRTAAVPHGLARPVQGRNPRLLDRV